MITKSTLRTSRPTATHGITSRLALGAIVGPVAFTIAWLILGALSPGYTLWGTVIAPYSAVHQPISGLGLGVTGPAMNTAFVLCGMILLAGVFGVVRSIPLNSACRRACIALLGFTPIGMVACGIFTLRSFFPHTLGFLLAAGAPVLAFAVTGFILRRVPTWRRLGTLLILGSPLTLMLMVVYFATFTPTIAGIQTGVAGLTQRLLVIEVHAWFVAMGWWAVRQPRVAPSRHD